ncbi:DUF2185 domain-containing protein [Wielerella bovis]|uniref:DUF2185 domain-containing protein n=1 Tax=Wielerella bovis TaxID=2917790 RepID=UPI002019A811|nr:DUF2185 domain-containing protein [Wielerella bovis]ULJ63004.1 DUF2185 domain-containing protein [Wielerella bovis]
MNPFAQALSAALEYAIVSRQVSVDGEPIGFVYREPAAFPHDSGWRMFSGAETDEYVENPAHFDTLVLRDLLAGNPELADLMKEKQGAWEWDDETGTFVPVSDWQPQE